jgi:hypothetical protein
MLKVVIICLFVFLIPEFSSKDLFIHSDVNIEVTVFETRAVESESESWSQSRSRKEFYLESESVKIY